MAASIIVEVRKAVVAGIDALLDPNGGTSCTYGWTGGSDDKRREQIYTNRPRATHEPASMRSGRNFRNESMDFDICLFVSDPTNPPEVVDERVMEIGQAIEEFVADHKSNELGIDGLYWIQITAFELENRLMETGAASLATWTVHYEARLT
jgi:hypothetical protein